MDHMMADSSGAPTQRDYQHLAATIEKLSTVMEQFPTIMAATYVRQDVYQAHQDAHRQKHVEQDEEIDRLTKFKEMAVRIAWSAAFVAPGSAIGYYLQQGR